MQTYMNSASIAGKNGIPPRTPTSVALWSHLLRKETLPAPPNSEIDPLLAPLAPIDKNATSTRVLLYDTQAHLERFSIHVEKLCSTIEDTAREISTANTLFQSEHEKLEGNMIDLVNRSQMHILKTIGEPAQAAQLAQLTKDVDRRMEALDKRVDAMQAFNQTHSQALQTQSQVLHALQDQQATMIAALGPLLPLLQAIPLHIESAKNNLNEAFMNSAASFSNVCTRARVVTPTYRGRSDSENGISQQARSASPEKRSSSTLCSSPLSRKRPRVDCSDGAEVLSPISRGGDHLDISRRTKEQAPSPRRATPIRIHRRESIRQALLTSISKPPAGSLTRRLTDTSSRRVLGDIPVASCISTKTHTTTRKPMPPRTIETPPAVEHTPNVVHGGFTKQTITKAQKETPVVQTNTRNIPAPSFRTTCVPTPASSISFRLPPPLIEHPINHEALEYQAQTKLNSLATPRRVPTGPSSPTHSRTLLPSQKPLSGPGIPSPPRVQTSTTIAQHQDGPGIAQVAVRTWVKPTPIFKVRERRSPFREGRRFIPLADTDDDEDEDENDGFI